MRSAWLMFVVFTSALGIFPLFAAESEFGRFVSVRAVIFLSLAAGLVCSLYEQKALRSSEKVAVSDEQVKFKSLPIFLGLLALLVYPSAMARVLPKWPTVDFNTDYLLLLPILFFLTPWYVRWVESRMPRPDDGYARFGQALLGQRPWLWTEHKSLLLAWTVKAFFIPLMYSWLVAAVEVMLFFSWQLNPGLLVVGLFSFGLSVDLLIASGGYFFSSRILGNDIKSTDATWMGWLVCVICYPPFLQIFQAIKQQTDNVIWSDWLLPDEPLYWVWAFLITASWIVYWLATVSFGLRFSNLSWRGLVDVGPYRYVKHPAYLAKNIYWWLHTVPFVGVETNFDLLRNLLGLTFVSMVYYLRAKTEERHLMAFPEYAAYSEGIGRNGLLARCTRLFWPK